MQGATPDDLQTLLEAGLIAPPGASVAASAAAPAPAAPTEPTQAFGPDGTLGYGQLYEQLNAQIKKHLGLIKGYHFSLEIEKASSLADLREVAVRLVDEVQRAKGEGAAQSAQVALGLAL